MRESDFANVVAVLAAISYPSPRRAELHYPLYPAKSLGLEAERKSRAVLKSCAFYWIPTFCSKRFGNEYARTTPRSGVD
jgi:hypothetical protein